MKRLHLRGEAIDVRVVTKACENTGIGFDSSHLKTFLEHCIVDTVRPTRHA